MATESDLINIKSRLASLRREISNLETIRNDSQELLEADQELIRRLDGQTAATGLTPRGAELLAAAKQRVPQLQQQISNAETELGPLQTQAGQLATQQADLEKQLAAERPQPAPPATASQTVKDDAPAGPTAAPEQKVGPDGRVVDVPPNTAPTNAEVTPTQQNPEGTTSGTDAPVKSAEQIQAIKADSNNGQAVPVDPAAGAPSPTTKAGAAAQPDDNVPAGTPQTAVNAEEQTGPNVKPRPNVLDDYASYSYSASVYLMTEVQYARLLQSTTKKIDGYQLLFQSGGAANNVGGIRPPGTSDTEYSGPDGGRNPFFDNDFYIDSITIENLPPGKSTGSAHNVSGLKFTLVEPNGITLLDRLYDAVANLAPKGGDGKVNYTAPTYLMVIRFYGYDAEGNLMQVRSKPDQEGTSDPGAIVEKFIPFKIKSLNWTVGTKLVSYEWDCVPTGQMIAGYTNRGTIPADVQLVNTTVGGLLGGDVTYSTTSADAATPWASTTATSTDPRQRRSQVRLAASQASAAAAAPPAPAKADAAPTNKKTITGGLMGAMNEFQAKLVKDGVFTIPDEYVIEFVGPDANKIRDAKLQLPNTKVDKRMTAAGQAPTQDAQALDQAKTSVDMISRSFSITAGQQLLQAIDLTIRNSSYISDQALVIVNPDGTTQPNPNSRNKPLKWFTIGMSAVPIGDKIDPKRNDYAYRITYTVAAREVKNVISKYFPVSKFSGVHKRYPYWFTGENIAVLDYQETLNAMYHLTVSGGENEKSAASRTREAFTSSMADIVTYNYAPTSTESNKGADGKSLEAAANAAEVLYSPGDLRECKLKIVGDPAWIMQGSTFRVLSDEMLGGTALNTGFLPDGSIAFDNQDVLFEIAWQRPEDYDLDTGLADPYSQTQKKYNNRTALQSRVYLCKKVVSEFRQGAFTQTLEGALYLFPIPSKTNTANPAAANSTADQSRSDPRLGTRDDPRQGRGFNRVAPVSGGGRGSPEFDENDPRRLDRGDGGRAAILGAQAASNARRTPAPGELGSGSFGVVNTAAVASGQLGSGTFTIENAPVARPPTSGTGGTVTNVPETVGNGPRKLPASGTSNQAAAQQLRETIRAEQRAAVGSNPVTSGNSTTQPIARDF